MDINTLIVKYNEELKVDTSVDELNLKEFQMKHIANKHKWVARLLDAKRDLIKLEKSKQQVISDTMEHIRSNAKVSMSDIAIKRAAEGHESIVKYDELVSDQKLLIEYLSNIQDIMRSLTYDVKNIIEIMKLENT